MDRALDRGAAFAVCAALLLTCYLRTAEGTQHPSPWGYRGWAFDALAYSDILALHEDRGAAKHAFPYLEDKIEYPVVLGLSMWAPSVVAPNRAGYFALTFVALALCALGTLALAKNRWAWAASPALVVYGALNWDLLAILPLALGLWLWHRKRDVAAVAVLSLAVWTKFFPLLALGLVLVLALRTSVKRALQLGVVFLAVTLLVNLPFALVATENWSWFFVYNRIREIEPSLYLLAGASARGFVTQANAISAAVTIGAAAAIAFTELKTKRLELETACCALFCVFFIANKVYSPQYWLWVVALIALANAPGWLASAVSAVAFADYVVSFSRLHFSNARDWPQARWFDGTVFVPMIAIRYATLAACALWAFSHLLHRETEI